LDWQGRASTAAQPEARIADKLSVHRYSGGPANGDSMTARFQEVVDKIERKRVTPGIHPGAAETVRYVSFDRSRSPTELYPAVVDRVRHLLPENGGLFLEAFIVTVPDGTSFYALNYSGDVAGWRAQIEQGAADLDLLTAKIESDTFVVSDRRSYPLSECTVERDRTVTWIEDIVGRIEREPATPGTRPGQAEKVRYVSFDRSQNPAELFHDVVRRVKPVLAKNGGVNQDRFIVTLPDGTPFYALKYHGDVAGWRAQIEQGAADLGFLTAKIESDTFVVSDGRSYPLSECTVERDNAALKLPARPRRPPETE
jgi:hypothetical protein